MQQQNPFINHFLNPRNVGDAAEPSFTGCAGSITCGATVCTSIQIDESQTIADAKFRAAGCEVLIASLSIITGLIIGTSTADAATKVTRAESLATELEARPDKAHCIQLACDALLNSIRAYSDAAREEWSGDEALICTCFFVSEQTIEREIRQRSLTTVREVTEACNAGGGCGSCQPLILDILESLNMQS